MSQPDDIHDSPAPVIAATMPSRFGIGVNVLLQLLLLLVLFGAVNYVGFRYFARWDLSAGKSYSLSGVTTGYLRKLSKEVEITAIFPRSSKVVENVQTLLEEYRAHGKRLIDIHNIDPARDTERAEKLKAETGVALSQSGVLIQANKSTRFIPEEELVVRSPTDPAKPIVAFRGEEAITAALIGLMEGKKRRLYLVVGKGSREETLLPDAAKSLGQISAQQNFELVLINLADTTRLPEDAEAVILVGPRYDLSERELAMFEEYWNDNQRAGLMIMLDPSSSTPRLDGFLQSNGARPRGDRVLFAESTSTGPHKEYGVEASFSSGSSITRFIADSVTHLGGQSESLELRPDLPELKERSISVTPLIAAADRYWGETAHYEALPLIDDADTKPPLYIGAAIERGAVPDARLRVDSGRMVAIGNASMLDSQSMLAVNQDFISSALNWMVNRERLVGGITPKPRQAYRIQLTPRQHDLLFWLTTFILPSVFLSIGFMIWTGRRAA
ncbi:MAG: GldG family protein [Verrucomicrobiaceae bacterium]|nr:GldG family protein [Verrucomicrobiaceae bacterium]